MGGLSIGTLVSFLISPLFGYRHFGLSEFWVLIPMFVVYGVGVIWYVLGMASDYSKQDKEMLKSIEG